MVLLLVISFLSGDASLGGGAPIDVAHVSDALVAPAMSLHVVVVGDSTLESSDSTCC